MAAIPSQFRADGADVRVRRQLRLDGWTNAITGLGVAARDKRLSTTFGATYKLNHTELETLFHDEALIRRVCELPAKEMTREWIEINGDTEGKLTQGLQALKARRKFTEALTWGRLYGAGVIVMMVEDGRSMDQPLNIEGARAINDLIVLDRFDLQVMRKYQNPTLPKYGEPEIYAIRTSMGPPGSATGQGVEGLIHESRCLIFEGSLTGARAQRNNEGWPLSVVHSLYEVIRDFVSANQGVAHLIQDYSQGVYKIKGLAEALSSDQDDVIIDRLQLMDMCRSVARAIVLDEKESFDRITTSVAGLADMLLQLAMYLSAVTDIPLTKLLGRSPQGMNATGESDERNWNNHVRSMQETDLRDPLSVLLKVLAKAVGFTPKDAKNGQISFEFRSLHQPSDDEKAKTRFTVAQTDQIYHGLGVTDTAEIAVSRFGGDKYSIETTIDQTDHDPTKATDDDDEIDPLLKKEGDDEDPANDPAAKKLAAKGVPTDKTVQDTALNGAQVTALMALLDAVGQKTVFPEAAKIAIKLAFPNFDPTEIASMVDAQKNIEKEELPAPVIAPGQPKPAAVPVPAPKKEGDA